MDTIGMLAGDVAGTKEERALGRRHGVRRSEVGRTSEWKLS
jgi:hypothetical protein